jgi:hypothetical protein
MYIQNNNTTPVTSYIIYNINIENYEKLLVKQYDPTVCNGLVITLTEHDLTSQLNFDDIVYHFMEIRARKEDFEGRFFIILINLILCLYLLLLICVCILVSNCCLQKNLYLIKKINRLSI